MKRQVGILRSVIAGFFITALLFLVTGCPNPSGSGSAPAVPGAPALTAGDASISAVWTAVPKASAYEVWFGTTDSSASAAKFGDDVTGTSATITSLVNGTAYYVWLKAKNAAGLTGFGAVASSAPIYIADSYNNRILRMEDIYGNGMVSFSSCGTETNQFWMPNSVFVDPATSKVYIVDYNNKRVVRSDDMQVVIHSNIHKYWRN
jgi:hypothetical protein